MKRLVLGALVAGGLGLIAAGCTEDPLAALRGTGPKRLLLSASALTVNVNDSVAVTVTVADEQGNPLPDAASATSSAPTIVSVSSSSGAPLPQSKFFVKGLLFGQGYVKVTAGGVTDSIKVLTYPASVSVTGQVDSINSGSSFTLNATPRDAVGGAMTGVTPITWGSDDDAVASVTTPGASATVSAYSPGVANITARVPGGANAPVPVRVVPAPFGGGLSAASGAFSDIITATKGAGDLDFDDATTVTVGDSPTFVTVISPSQISFPMPPVTTGGSKQVWFRDLGPDALATRTVINATAPGLDDAHETDDPFTSTEITADGDAYFIVHGDCHPDNVNTDPGLPHAPTDDCDDFFRITNTSGATTTVTIEMNWPEASDVDLYLFDSAFDGFLDGSFFDQPEEVVLDLAAGESIIVYINLYDAAGTKWSFGRLRVTGL